MNSTNNFCYTGNIMKKIFIFVLFLFIVAFVSRQTFAQAPTSAGPRYNSCDRCGYCPPNPAPQSWKACQKCLYPNINPDPAALDSLKVNTTPTLGRQFSSVLGCIKSNNGFGQEGAVGGVVQTLLNIIFSMSGGIAFLYLIYGSFIIATSQSTPDRLNYGRRVVYGAIAGLIFTLGSVFVVKFIASGILKVPGFGE